jgi:hypothetical protein
VLAEASFPLDGSFSNLGSDDDFLVEIEYLKVRESELSSASDFSVVSTSSALSSSAVAATVVSRSRFVSAMRIRLGKPGTTAASSGRHLLLPLDLESFVSRQGVGRVSIASHSRRTSSTQSNAVIELYRMSFQQRLTLDATIPPVSAHTQAHHSDTTAGLLEEIGRFQVWMALSLRVDMPPIYCVLFDDEVLGVYETLFSNLIKVLSFFSLIHTWTVPHFLPFFYLFIY